MGATSPYVKLGLKVKHTSCICSFNKRWAFCKPYLCWQHTELRAERNRSQLKWKRQRRALWFCLSGHICHWGWSSLGCSCTFATAQHLQMHPLCSLGGSLKWKERAAFLLASFIFGLSGLYGSYLGDTTCKLCAVVTDTCSFKLSAAARRLRSRILGWRQYVFRLYHFLSESGPIKRATPVTQFFVMLLASAGREIWDNTSCYDWTDATVGWHCCYLLMKSLYHIWLSFSAFAHAAT